MPDDVVDLTGRNARIFNSTALADWYAEQSLCPAETVILLRYRQAFLGKSVLDLGVGSGRTTRFLLPFAERYVGVDLSRQMLARCRREFPAATLYNLDICDLADLGEMRFDFVMASWAVLDALSPDDRILALKHVAAVTAPGGMLILSAHNRDAAIAGQPPSMAWTWRPDRLMRESLHYALATLNYLQRKHLRRENAQYALFNDMAHRWTGVFYYIDRKSQTAQLNEFGFDVLEVVGENGRSVAPGDDVSLDGCLHYVSCKR